MNQSEREAFHAREAAGIANDQILQEAREEQARINPAFNREEAKLMDEAARSSEPKFAEQARPLTGQLPGSGNATRALSSTQVEGVEAPLVGAHGKHGAAVNSYADLKDDSIVYARGMQIPALTASKLGILSKNPDGSFGPPVVPTPEALAAEAAEKAEADKENAPVDIVSGTPLADAFQTMTDLTGDPAVTERAVVSVLSAATSKGMAEAGAVLVNRLNLNGATEDGEGFVRNSIEAGRASVAARLNAEGLPGEATIDFVASHFSAADRVSIATGLLQGRKESWDRLREAGRKVVRAANAPR